MYGSWYNMNNLIFFFKLVGVYILSLGLGYFAHGLQVISGIIKFKFLLFIINFLFSLELIISLINSSNPISSFENLIIISFISIIWLIYFIYYYRLLRRKECRWFSSHSSERAFLNIYRIIWVKYLLPYISACCIKKFRI